MRTVAALLVGAFLLSLPSGIMSFFLLMALLHDGSSGRHSPKELPMGSDLIARYRKGILAGVGFASELVALGVLHGWPLYIAQGVIAAAAAAGVVLVPNAPPPGAGGPSPEDRVAHWNALANAAKGREAAGEYPPSNREWERELLIGAGLIPPAETPAVPTREIRADAVRPGMRIMARTAGEETAHKVLRAYELGHLPGTVAIEAEGHGTIVTGADQTVRVWRS